MKRILTFFLALFIALGTSVKADEGMWLPMLVKQLNYAQMKAMGLQLTPEQIYDINNSSLKDAIVIFGRGCTGEIISPEGLLLTNHHCGYGSIQAVSTVEHDYLTDGFWAYSKKEEIPIEGLTVQFLVRIDDVTKDVLDGVTDEMTEQERNDVIGKHTKELAKKLTEGTNYKAVVKPFFGGNEYYAYIYETFKDIRLAGAPPSSIGKFGADTDNWMWPRHTGDFSMFRVYTAPDGSPAEYAEDNVPLKSKHFLPINISGVKNNDFAMILGYPGSTDRYLTSYGVDLAIDESNPTIVEIRRKKLDIMREDMDASDEVRIKYASKYAGTANYWKYFIGQTKGLKRLKVAEKKKELEDEFQKWADANPERQKKYGEALQMIEDAYKNIAKYNLSKWYFFEGVYRGPEILRYAGSFARLAKALESKDKAEEAQKMAETLKASAAKHFKNYNAPTDQKLLAAMLEMYVHNVPADQQPGFLKELNKKYKGDFAKYADKVFEKSIFTSQAKVDEFLSKPKAKAIKKDMAYKAFVAFMKQYREISGEIASSDKMLARGNRLFIDGLRKMNPDKVYYPDANFTQRLTYGTVQDYYPADAVHYNYFTTVKGILEKEDPDNWEFVVPEKLKELINNEDFGPYGENGDMKVCFLTTHDITGGNSGSPVINGKGELIGLAFDGNWEAMSGDIAFEPELQRTINVDIRYVMFIIDKFAGAQNLIDEMTITDVDENPAPAPKIVEEMEELQEVEEAAPVE
jgi:hypothetical protein